LQSLQHLAGITGIQQITIWNFGDYGIANWKTGSTLLYSLKKNYFKIKILRTKKCDFFQQAINWALESSAWVIL